MQSVGGGIGDQRVDSRARRRQIADEARLARSLGGNLLRTFWSVDSVLAGPPEEYSVALNSVLRADLNHRAVFMQSLEHRVEQLDRCNAVLDQLLLAVDDRSESRFGLDFSLLDAQFDGLDDANRGVSEPVGLLLALVSAPPRWIIEAPSDVTLTRMGRGYSFASLWDRYVRFHAQLYRRLLIRYSAERPGKTLRALEIFNEPDYNWTPEEAKIEGAAESLVNPLGKYVTELMLPQVPTSDRGYTAFEPAPWSAQPQDAAWTEWNRAPVGVLDFDWGPKFDWYVMCAAQLQSHCARAIKETAAVQGVDVLTVSGSVTHNNIDFLLRMHRGDQATFESIDKIGLHPYHWVNNDVWDDSFVRRNPIAGWPSLDPRGYATAQFKRFDFLSAFRESSGDRTVDAEIRSVFGGRKLWLTEFGIGSKVLGTFNAIAPQSNRLIRPRGFVGASAGYPDVIWEDLWQAFVDQVDERWFRDQNVECFLIYGLRELDRPGFDLDDQDRSNLALFRGDCSPRLDPALIRQVGGLMGRITGLPPGPLAPPEEPCVPPKLYRRPWRDCQLSTAATAITTMLSVEERQALYWLTSSYYSGIGAIVDAGCFVGGSTVALAEGLQSTASDAMIDVYDRFEVEAYMNDLYFNDKPLPEGASFLWVFERNTQHVADRLRVHDGDLLRHGWSQDPIEIMFVDLSKTWDLNDFIVAEFFPSLIAGRSIVVQQDYVFAGCPWVALTMEYLSDYFEPIGFAEYCSVAYLCRRPIPRDVSPVSSIPIDRQLELMDRAIGRFLGYPRNVLQCAKAALLIEHGDGEAADAILRHVAGLASNDYPVQAALELLSTYR